MDEKAPSGAAICRVPLCPEIQLHLKPSGVTLDTFRAAHETTFGAAPPYWAVAWPGGQALARYLLDNPEVVRGRRVVDFGSGSGLVAIAAARAGAACVTAVDRDANAVASIKLNACLNDVFIDAHQADLEADIDPRPETALAGDLWYDRFDARRATSLLRRLAGLGTIVIAGDPARAHFPRRGVEPLSSYTVPTSADIEGGGEVAAGVWRILPHAADA